MKNIQFINAGAGSGKTYTLTEILAKNILEGKCNAGELILTTFSENSAMELKARTREVLLKKKEMAGQANLLNSAAIGTVHAVAFQFIKKYWYHLGSSVDLKVMTPEDVDFYLSQALANVPEDDELSSLRELARELSFKSAMSSTVNYDLWKYHLEKIIGYAITNKITDLSESKKASLAECSLIFPTVNVNLDEDSIKEVLKNLKPLIENDKDTIAKTKRIKNIEILLLKNSWSIPEFWEASSILTDTTKVHRNALPAIENQIQQLSNLYASESFVGSIMNYIELVFSLAQKSLDAFKEYKKRQRLIDFNDMEAMFLELLENEEVKKDISGSYKQVFVDEFQDSSPIQFEIFNRLSELVEQSYWVGDPKQAIYGFRGTNPELIGAIIDKFETKANGLSIDLLDKSWRSRPGIVNIVNEIFVPALKDQVKDEKYIRLNPVRSDDELPPDNLHPPVQHWHMKDIAKRGNAQLKWHHLAESINSLLKSNINVTQKDKCKYFDPADNKENVIAKDILKPNDVAILCKDNNSISELAACLRGFGINVAGKQRGIKETAEVQLLMAAINFLLDPTDQLAKAILLLLGGKFNSTTELIDDRLLHLYAEGAPGIPEFSDDTDEKEKKEYYRLWNEYTGKWGSDFGLLDRIRSLETLVAGSSIPLLVEKLVVEGGLYDLVRKWDNPVQRMANLQTLVKTAHTYDERCITFNIAASLTGYIRFIDSLGEKTFMQSAATGDDAVNILTYHGAKGLEWPVVILTELEKNKADESSVIQKSFFGVCDENPDAIDPEKPFSGKLIKLMPWPFGSTNSRIPEDIKNRILETPRYRKVFDRESNESARLLYVGFTRARDMIITTTYRNNKPLWLEHVCGEISLKGGIDDNSAGEYSLPFFNTSEKIPVKVLEFDAEMNYPEHSNSKVLQFQKVIKERESTPKFVSPSSLEAIDKIVVSELADFKNRIETGKISKEREAEMGNCLHAIYAAYDSGAPENEFLDLISKTIQNHHLQGNLTHPEHIFNAVKKLFIFLTETYGKPLRIYRELPLQMEDDGVIYRGEADLVWETENGLILVDYKSYPGGRNHLLSPGDENYAGKYSGHLHKYKEMIESGHPEHKKILETLLFYSVSGLVLRNNF